MSSLFSPYLKLFSTKKDFINIRNIIIGEKRKLYEDKDDQRYSANNNTSNTDRMQ